MKTKNKHGRKGVKRYVPQRPLDAQQRIDAQKQGYASGYLVGQRRAYAECLNAVNGARTIRDARRRIQELVDGQA